MLCAAVIFAAVPFAFSVNSNADAVAYSQYDSRWGSWVYGEGTIAGTGCGILSTVNAFNYLNEIADVAPQLTKLPHGRTTSTDITEHGTLRAVQTEPSFIRGLRQNSAQNTT